MSNVAMHMFPDGVTRAVFAEVGRLVRPGGLFVFHVNALEDRPLRARRLPARELEPDYVAEESGQTMHFFSESYLRELLGGWQDVDLAPVPVPDRETGELSMARPEPSRLVCDRRTTTPVELPGERTREDDLERTCPDQEMAAIGSRDTCGQDLDA